MDTTFQGYIEKKNLQFKNPENIELQQAETAFMQQTTEGISEYGKQYDQRGYTESEISKAAEFMLKARQYGLDDVKSLDVSDSPIFYKTVKGKKTARGYFDRKSLQKAGNNLINFAKKQIKEMDSILYREDFRVNEETWKRQEDDTNGEQPNLTDEMLKSFETNGVLEVADKQSRMEQTEKEENPSAYFMQDRTAEAMKTKLPDFNILMAKMNVRYMKDYAESEHWLDSKEEKAKRKKKIEELYHKKVDKFKKIYNDAQKGLISPEAFKVFMQKDIMTLDTDETMAIYSKLQHRDSKGRSSSYEEYKNEFEKLLSLFKPVNTDRQGNAFMHMKGTKFVDDRREKGTKERIYITGRGDKQVEMIRAFKNALQQYPDVKDYIYFKATLSPESERMDNIVIYVSNIINKDQLNQMLATFQQECGAGVLETKENMPSGNAYVSDGISSAPDIHLGELLEGFKADSSKMVDNKSKSVTQHYEKEPSYTQHLAMILYTAVNMARQKCNLKKEDELKNNPEAMKAVHDYFKDLLRLSNVDPATITSAA